MSDKMMRMAGRGVDGKAKAVKTSNSGALLTIERAGGFTNIHTHTASLTPGQVVVLMDTNYSTIIDSIDWLARHETDAEIYIEIKGASFSFINADGTGVLSWINPKALLNSKSLLFNIVQYDTTTSPDPKFRFHLKKPLYCPNGIKVRLRNISEDKTFRNSCQVIGRNSDEN